MFSRLMRLPFWGWSLISGILLGFSVPGFHVPLLGLIALFPLLVALEKVQTSKHLKRLKLKQSFWACAICGAVSASIGGTWITHSANIFGQLPWPVALLITALGYGLEVTLMLFVLFALPLFWSDPNHTQGWRDLPARLFFVLALEPFYPRLIYWTFGGLTFDQIPWIAQLADIIGSTGLGFYSIGFNFLLLLLWRKQVDPSKFATQASLRLVAVFLVLSSIGLSYGAWRSQNLRSLSAQNSNSASQKTITVTALQPNFSLKHLASNPKLAYSDRTRNLQGLLEDSKQALSSQKESVTSQTNSPPPPQLLVWPESTYPNPYFKDRAAQKVLAHFAQSQNTGILLSSVDWEAIPSQKRQFKFYGISALIDSTGQVIGSYRKMFLIPFGEYIPAATWFPAFANFLRKNIQNLSEFEAGKEYTVWDWKGVKISAPICFDIFLPELTRNMARNGAEIIINLSNLAWFGKTNASDSMEMVIRWRAIENRVPVLFVSNNGKSVFIDAKGDNIGSQLALFEEGFLSANIALKKHFSVYRDYAEWIQAAWVLIFLFFFFLERKQRREMTP